MSNQYRPVGRDRQRGWISRNVDFDGVQARMKVNGTPLTRAFSVGRYGSLAAAERAAEAWLCALRAELPSRYASELRKRPAPQKADRALPVGVNETHQTLRSGGQSTRFQVLWHDGRRPRMKSFVVGTDATATPARWRAARKRAIAFRQAYVRCRTAGRVFDPQRDAPEP